MPLHHEFFPRMGKRYLCALLLTVVGTAMAHANLQIPEPLLEGIENYEQGSHARSGVAEFRIGDRWNRTATDGFSSNRRGDPINLTWGFVADGTSISGGVGEPTSGSDLISNLDTLYGRGTGPASDLEARPWFSVFESSFDRWSELSGINYEYEPNDGGAAINGFSNPQGQPGVYADVRIGGHPIDGSSGQNTLAYNYFPDHADMVIDTDNTSLFTNRANNSRFLRNVLMHEAGHGLGFNHLESNNSRQLMEPFISTLFDGPQFDDILAAHRNYGDAFENIRGDARSVALDTGEFGAADRYRLGSDARQTRVAPTATDFVSIDGSDDVDFYELSVSEPVFASVTVVQAGPTYNEGAQDGTQTSLDTSRLNELEFEVLVESPIDGIAVIAESSILREINHFANEILLLPGNDYFVRVSGNDDNVQLYELRLDFVAAPIPEPTAVLLAGGCLIGLIARRRIA